MIVWSFSSAHLLVHIGMSLFQGIISRMNEYSVLFLFVINPCDVQPECYILLLTDCFQFWLMNYPTLNLYSQFHKRFIEINKDQIVRLVIGWQANMESTSVLYRLAI